jgi:hypothetical protein
MKWVGVRLTPWRRASQGKTGISAGIGSKLVAPMAAQSALRQPETLDFAAMASYAPASCRTLRVRARRDLAGARRFAVVCSASVGKARGYSSVAEHLGIQGTGVRFSLASPATSSLGRARDYYSRGSGFDSHVDRSSHKRTPYTGSRLLPGRPNRRGGFGRSGGQDGKRPGTLRPRGYRLTEKQAGPAPAR